MPESSAAASRTCYLLIASPSGTTSKRGGSYLHLMSDEQDGLADEKVENDSTKDGQRDVRVDGGKRVVQQVDVAVAVDGPGQADPLTLTTAQRHAAVSDHRRVTVRQRRHVRVQTARLHHRRVPTRQRTFVAPSAATSPSHVAWSEGRRPIGAALHSPDEPSELSQ